MNLHRIAMARNALYFPYISIPGSQWTTQMLLYWDRLSSIVPFDHVEAPEQFTHEMQRLLHAGLVQQVFPAEHLQGRDAFAEPFIKYLGSHLESLKGEPSRSPTLLHIEKMGTVSDYLEKHDLARRANYPWYEVDARVAAWFMAYLATVLGSFDEVDAAPVTNELQFAGLLRGIPFARPVRGISVHHAKARDVVLRDLLPFPATDAIDVDNLIRFKIDHGELLARFRTSIETKAAEIARIDAPSDRLEATRAFIAHARSEVAAITDAMRSRWSAVNFGSLCTLGSAALTTLATGVPSGGLAAAGFGLGLLGAISSGVGNLRPHAAVQLQRPLAYAAVAQLGFSKVARDLGARRSLGS